MRRLYQIMPAVLALALGAASAHADLINLISNGSFEDGAKKIGRFVTVKPQEATITDWRVTSGTVDYIGTYWQASDGNRSIDLTGTPDNGTLATTFTTTPGITYKVLFDLAGNFEISDTNYRSVKVSAGNHSNTYTFYKPENWSFDNMGWQTQTFYFTALDHKTILTFQSLSTHPYCGPTLDNVRAYATPLPPPVVLLGSGLLGLVLWGRRRRA